MVIYGNVGTSVVALMSSSTSVFPQFLNAGPNPRSGVLFHYYLAQRPQQPLTLNIRSSSGDLVRSFNSDGDLSAEPGFNHFHWNLCYPGVPDVAESLVSWDRPHGPLVLPGKYTAELVTDAASFSQAFEVLADPRIEVGPEELAAQQIMLLEILERLAQNNDLLNKLVALKAQLQGWIRRSDDPAITSAAGSLIEAVDARLPALINTGIAEAQLYPSGLHEKFNALFDSVDSADYAPPQQARAVFQQLSAELDEHRAWVASELIEDIRDFNQLIRDAGFGAVDLL
jgi:hypothetical protein